MDKKPITEKRREQLRHAQLSYVEKAVAKNRRRKGYYLTPEEHKKVKDFIKKLREENQ